MWGWGRTPRGPPNAPLVQINLLLFKRFCMYPIQHAMRDETIVVIAKLVEDKYDSKEARLNEQRAVSWTETIDRTCAVGGRRDGQPVGCSYGLTRAERVNRSRHDKGGLGNE